MADATPPSLGGGEVSAPSSRVAEQLVSHSWLAHEQISRLGLQRLGGLRQAARMLAAPLRKPDDAEYAAHVLALAVEFSEDVCLDVLGLTAKQTDGPVGALKSLGFGSLGSTPALASDSELLRCLAAISTYGEQIAKPTRRSAMMVLRQCAMLASAPAVAPGAGISGSKASSAATTRPPLGTLTNAAGGAAASSAASSGVPSSSSPALAARVAQALTEHGVTGALGSLVKRSVADGGARLAADDADLMVLACETLAQPAHRVPA
eukprot:CAMPEP_0119509704 /NCGR_PEP_ID=MMETSP1344-20130328/28898_1 /TAXON_ID=236787 /ORGANISM="Florenciella parvula, Strain CCMP2471" /LENGTH=263 /DNA_ID=CAMNT_0007546553 /DNA_START=10 /DNA_END=797 /DNA_ORIENTATION=+